MERFLYDSFAFKNFLENHPHEAGEVRFLKSIAKKGMHAIDIGANIGITTVAIAKRIQRGGKLHSFEPVPEYYNILKDNVFSNGLENVKVYKLAVTDQVGRV
jgi:predicted O-methyltransferase YrrM